MKQNEELKNRYNIVNGSLKKMKRMQQCKNSLFKKWYWKNYIDMQKKMSVQTQTLYTSELKMDHNPNCKIQNYRTPRKCYKRNSRLPEIDIDFR